MVGKWEYVQWLCHSAIGIVLEYFVLKTNVLSTTWKITVLLYFTYIYIACLHGSKTETANLLTHNI